MIKSDTKIEDLSKFSLIKIIPFTDHEIHQDPIFGDEVPLLLVKDGVVYNSECFEVSDIMQDYT